MCHEILTLTGSLWLGFDLCRLTLERTFLTHWSSWLKSSNVGSSCFWLMAMGTTAVRWRLIVPDLIVSYIMVLFCSRHNAHHVIALILSSYST